LTARTVARRDIADQFADPDYRRKPALVPEALIQRHEIAEGVRLLRSRRRPPTKCRPS
jgi:hypothetical protein